MMNDLQLIEYAKERHKENQQIDFKNTFIVEESYFGVEYKAIHLPLKKGANNQTNTSLALIDLYDPNKEKYYECRRKFLYRRLDLKTFTGFIIPYTIVYSLIGLSYFYAEFLLVLSFILPIIFGFIFFKLFYDEMKDYLKKIADLIVITSGFSTAALLIIPYLPFKNFSSATLLSSLQKNYNALPILDDLKSLITLISIEFFIGFYTIKFLIALTETRQARNDYHSIKPGNPLPKNKLNFFQRLKSLLTSK